jgi:uroporphyrin-III C-methyltransferase
VNELLPQAAPELVEEQPTAPAAAPGGANPWVWAWALLIAVLASGAALMQVRFAGVQHELQALKQRDEELAALHTGDVAERQALQQRLDATLRRTEQLEQQLTVLAGRDISADAELRRLREEHVLAEVDELLTLAGSQLQLARDSTAAIIALSSADARLARLPRPQFFALREALARDIERLRRAPIPDMAGIAIRLDRLVQGVDSWHLLADPTRHLAPPPPRTLSDIVPVSRLGRVGREIGDTLRDLVRIRTVEAPDSLLLPPDQYQLMREHVRVRLLTARQSMLAHNQVLFRADLTDSQILINRYFDTSDPLVGAALAQIKTLEAAVVDAPMPALDDSLAALHAARPPIP